MMGAGLLGIEQRQCHRRGVDVVQKNLSRLSLYPLAEPRDERRAETHPPSAPVGTGRAELGRSTVIAFLNRLLRIRAKKDHMEFKDKKTKREKLCHTPFGRSAH
jgi:hypothetical protein